MSTSLNRSHNVCYALPHFDVSFWIEVDRGDFPCTDIVGEFSIIDDAFQVVTYGHHLISDRSLIENYSIRRCFFEFECNLPSRYEGVSHSFAVLGKHTPFPFSGSYIYHCRCYFESSDFSPIDFDLSLNLGELKTTTKKEKNDANQD